MCYLHQQLQNCESEQFLDIDFFWSPSIQDEMNAEVGVSLHESQAWADVEDSQLMKAAQDIDLPAKVLEELQRPFDQGITLKH
jgi:hypothetical protein